MDEAARRTQHARTVEVVAGAHDGGSDLVVVLRGGAWHLTDEAFLVIEPTTA